MADPNVSAIAETVLERELGSLGLDHVVVREDLDHDGTPSLFVEAFVKATAGRLGGEASSHVLGALSDALLDAGEKRFPYFHVRYLGDDLPEDASETEH